MRLFQKCGLMMVMTAIMSLMSVVPATAMGTRPYTFPTLRNGNLLDIYVLSIDQTNNQMEFVVNTWELRYKRIVGIQLRRMKNELLEFEKKVMSYELEYEKEKLVRKTEPVADFIHLRDESWSRGEKDDTYRIYTVDINGFDLKNNKAGKIYYTAEFLDGTRWVNDVDYSECQKQWVTGKYCTAAEYKVGTEHNNVIYELMDAPTKFTGRKQEEADNAPNLVEKQGETESEPGKSGETKDKASKGETDKSSETKDEKLKEETGKSGSKVVSEQPEMKEQDNKAGNNKIDHSAKSDKAENDILNRNETEDREVEEDKVKNDKTRDDDKIGADKTDSRLNKDSSVVRTAGVRPEMIKKSMVKLPAKMEGLVSGMDENAADKQTDGKEKMDGDDGDVDTDEGANSENSDETLAVPELGNTNKTGKNENMTAGFMISIIGGAALGAILTWFLISVIKKRKEHTGDL